MYSICIVNYKESNQKKRKLEFLYGGNIDYSFL